MKLAAHLIPEHWGQSDEQQLARIRPRSAKIIEHYRVGYAPTRTIQVNAATPKTLLVLRDHPLSEQYDDVWAAPEATGKRHADDWANKLRSWQSDQRWRAIPSEQIVVLGINEFPVWDDRGGPNNAKPNAKGAYVNTIYNVAFLERLTQHGIRGGALNLNTGWPANWGTDMPPIWEPFKPLESVILAGDHFLLVHEYWPHEGPQKHWGWLAGRYTKCPFDVPIIIGECGHEERVVNSTLPPEKWGWMGWMTKEAYTVQLLQYNAEIMKDKRIHSAQIFTWDFSHPFGSTDVRAVVPLWPANDTFDNMVNYRPPSPTPPVPIPPSDTLRDKLLAAGQTHQRIQFNPDAALQKAAFDDGYVINSGEFDATVDGKTYRGQRAERMDTGAVRIYYCEIGDWDNVQSVQR